MMQGQGVPGGIENRAAVNDVQRLIKAQPQAFDDGSEVPRIDRLAIGCRLTPHRVETNAVEESRPQRMERERFVKPSNRCRGLGQRRQ